MKPRIIKRTLSLITVLALIFTLAVQGAGAIQSADVNKYPYLYVHGLFGWGADEGINGTLPENAGQKQRHRRNAAGICWWTFRRSCRKAKVPVMRDGQLCLI